MSRAHALWWIPLAVLACDGGKTTAADDTSGASTAELDADGDGFSASDGDCDDNDNLPDPGADEVCDEVDNDCDGDIDEDPTDGLTVYADADGDGYGDATAPTTGCSAGDGLVTDATDCDDDDDATHPGADEVCDEADNDCDDDIDEDATDAETFHTDADGDGYGHPANTAVACAQADGLSADATDCDDGDPDRHPGAEEICNDEDDDCDGETDEVGDTWYLDEDGDGYGTDAGTTTSCDPVDGYGPDSGDCDDSSPIIHPDAAELCADGIDEDCDGEIDEDDCVDNEAWFRFQYSTDSDPSTRDCDLWWYGTVDEPEHKCPECEYNFLWNMTLDETESYDPYDLCGANVEWGLDLGYDDDYYGTGVPVIWYYVPTGGYWLAVFNAELDETTGYLFFYGGSYEEDRGSYYYTRWWEGAGIIEL